MNNDLLKALKESSITVNIKDSSKKITSKHMYYDITFFTDPNELSIGTNYNKYIRSIESQFRRSLEYTRYIDYIRNTIGLNHCMIWPKIDGDNAKIELHHGPLLTLYDAVSVLVEYCIAKGKKFNTYKILDMLTEAHFNNWLPIVMLSVTVHQLVTDGKIFIHPSQAFGNFNAFYEKYKEGFSDELLKKIEEYLEISEKFRSNDMGLLELGDYKNYSLAFSKIKHDLFK